MKGGISSHVFLEVNETLCDGCTRGKHDSKYVPSFNSPFKNILEVAHFDL